jgi:hypothetical protein
MNKASIHPKIFAMKRLFLLLVVGSIVFLSTGCRKNNDAAFEPGFLDEKYEDSFDWNTARILQIEIHSATDQFIQIRSVDNSVRYHRGMHTGSDGVYRVTLSIPKTVDQLMVNTLTLTVSEGVNRVDL